MFAFFLGENVPSNNPIDSSNHQIDLNPINLKEKTPIDSTVEEGASVTVPDYADQTRSLKENNAAETSLSDGAQFPPVSVGSTSAELAGEKVEIVNKLTVEDKAVTSMPLPPNDATSNIEGIRHSHANAEPSPTDISPLPSIQTLQNDEKVDPTLRSSPSNLSPPTPLPSEQTFEDLRKSPVKDYSMHHVKWISFNGSTMPTITQSENGPCPMIAITNLLLLRGDLTLPPKQEAVSSDFLIGALSEELLSYSTAVSSLSCYPK